MAFSNTFGTASFLRPIVPQNFAGLRVDVRQPRYNDKASVHIPTLSGQELTQPLNSSAPQRIFNPLAAPPNLEDKDRRNEKRNRHYIGKLKNYIFRPPKLLRMSINGLIWVWFWNIFSKLLKSQTVIFDL
jgi:hypothetical protein